jgi:hypothetical protein
VGSHREFTKERRRRVNLILAPTTLIPGAKAAALYRLFIYLIPVHDHTFEASTDGPLLMKAFRGVNVSKSCRHYTGSTRLGVS